MATIDLSSIYKNPRIPAGYYIAKITDVIEEPIKDEFPRVQVTLKIWDKEERGTELTSILHGSAKCKYYHKNFFATFRFDVAHSLAKGKWGCIEVYDAKYMQTEYSAVKYIYQKPEVKQKVIALEIAEEEGKLEW